MVKPMNATTRTIKENLDGPINQVTNDANLSKNRIPAAAKELESILEFFFSGSGYPVTQRDRKSVV